MIIKLKPVNDRNREAVLALSVHEDLSQRYIPDVDDRGNSVNNGSSIRDVVHRNREAVTVITRA